MESKESIVSCMSLSKFLKSNTKIAERALFNEGFDPHDWGKVENLVEEMTLKLKGLL